MLRFNITLDSQKLTIIFYRNGDEGILATKTAPKGRKKTDDGAGLDKVKTGRVTKPKKQATKGVVEEEDDCDLLEDSVEQEADAED
jgi:hypothetical protein